MSGGFHFPTSCLEHGCCQNPRCADALVFSEFRRHGRELDDVRSGTDFKMELAVCPIRRKGAPNQGLGEFPFAGRKRENVQNWETAGWSAFSLTSSPVLALHKVEAQIGRERKDNC